MNLEVNGLNIFLMILTTFICSVVLVPIAKKIAFHVGAYDYPNQRRLNKVPMPTIGGIAVFASFIIGYLIFGRKSVEMLSIIIAGMIIIFTGFIDDIKPISAKHQLIGQLLAVLVITIYGKITIENITILGLNLHFATPWNYIVTIIFMLGIINAIDLSDGMDGLSSGISIIYFSTVLIIAILLGMAGSIDTLIATLMIGALLGFLVYNFPPAKIYIGDSGSNFVGLMVSITALYGYKVATFTSLLIPLAILATPIIDVLFAIIRRSLKKENPFTTPDKEHLHHQLLKMKFSTKKSLGIIYFINICFAIASILYSQGNILYAFIMYIALMIVFFYLAIKTNILFPNKGEKNHEKK